MKPILILLSLTLSLSCNLTTQTCTTYPNPQIPSKPEYANNSELNKFVNDIIIALENNDTVAILNAIDDSVVVSDGGGIMGKESFKSYYLESNRGFWDLFIQAFELGYTIEINANNNTSYIFPYFQSLELQKKSTIDFATFDQYFTVLGTKKDMPIYSEPSEKSACIAKLDFPILTFQIDDTGYLDSNYVYVLALDSSLNGYAKIQDLYFLASLTIIIEKKSGKYKIVYAAGFD